MIAHVRALLVVTPNVESERIGLEVVVIAAFDVAREEGGAGVVRSLVRRRLADVEAVGTPE